MLTAIKRSLRYSFLAPVYERYAIAKWEQRGRPIPPPYSLKRRTIVEFANRFNCRTLVETGTYRGDTLWMLRGKFSTLYSIEIDEGFHRAAQARFRHLPHVHLVLGDSGTKLPEVAARLDAPALFWLDGHYSGPGTGRGEIDSPIWAEMEAVFAHKVRDHVILIDDAREFIGQGGYPTIDALRDWVKKRRPDWVFAVEHDIIRICPPKP